MYGKWIILYILIGFTILEPAYASNLNNSGQQAIESCWQKGADHAATIDCESKILDKSNQAMQSTYEKARASARISDKEMKQAGSQTLIHTEEAVVQSQKAFEVYMEKECDREVAYTMGGTYGADTGIKCKIDLIKERMAVLDRKYP